MLLFLLLFLGEVSDKWVLVVVVVVTSDWSEDDDVGDEELLDDVIYCSRLREREERERETTLFCFVCLRM